MTVSSKAIAFSGAEGCNDTATVKSLSVEGPLISIKHSGLTSSGWEMSITRDGGQMIVSAGIFSGTYAKGAPAPAAEPVAAPPAAPTLTELPDKLRGKYKKKDGTGKGASNKGKMTITKRKVMVTNCYNWEDYCNVTIDVAGVEEDDPLYTVSIRDNREQLGEMERAMKAHQGSKPFTISVNDNSIDISDHPYWSGTWTKQ